MSLSYGQSFHVNDPRIGTTAIQGGTIVSKARSYQLVVSMTVPRTEFRVTLEHVTTAQQLARISNDTGLQQDEGPGILKSVTVTARRNFSHARDRLTGQPTPEAPQLIWDVLATIDRLPFHLLARGEYAEVGRKPLGDGFVTPGARISRGADPTICGKGIDVCVNVLIAADTAAKRWRLWRYPAKGCRSSVLRDSCSSRTSQRRSPTTSEGASKWLG